MQNIATASCCGHLAKLYDISFWRTDSSDYRHVISTSIGGGTL